MLAQHPPSSQPPSPRTGFQLSSRPFSALRRTQRIQGKATSDDPKAGGPTAVLEAGDGGNNGGGDSNGRGGGGGGDDEEDDEKRVPSSSEIDEVTALRT